MRLQHFIDALEEFAALQGITVFRTSLSPWVVGRMDDKQVILRTGLSKEQQLLTLIHELTHFLAHRAADLDRTVCEYEAEAVEKLVGGRLGLNRTRVQVDLSEVTDDLLAGSVARVRMVARTLLNVLQQNAVQRETPAPLFLVERPAAALPHAALQPQTAVEI